MKTRIAASTFAGGAYPAGVPGQQADRSGPFALGTKSSHETQRLEVRLRVYRLGPAVLDNPRTLFHQLYLKKLHIVYQLPQGDSFSCYFKSLKRKYATFPRC